MDLHGRSILTILWDPGNHDASPETGSVNRVINNKTEKKHKTLRFYNRSRLIFTAPASQGAYAHIDEPARDPFLDSLVKDLFYKQIHFDDPLKLKIPYEFMAKRPLKPPDGMLLDIIAFIAVVLTFLWPVLCGYRRLLTIILRRKCSKFNDTLRGRNEDIVKEWKHKMNQMKKVALFTKSINEDRYAFLAENVDDSILSTWDTDGVFFCVDNCATCIICNDKSLFVGDLKPCTSEVHTSNGQNTPALEGTIRLVLTDDTGDRHQYDIKGALYDPESPFNLLGI
eukprot:scaffold104389_cov21-Cyclotella_meneghiniana.AAC.1